MMFARLQFCHATPEHKVCFSQFQGTVSTPVQHASLLLTGPQHAQLSGHVIALTNDATLGLGSLD